MFHLRRHLEIKPKKLTLSLNPNLNPNPSPNSKPNLNPNQTRNLLWIACDVIALLVQSLDIKIAVQRYVNACKNADSKDNNNNNLEADPVQKHHSETHTNHKMSNRLVK